MEYFAIITLVLLGLMIASHVKLLNSQGIKAVKFASLDKTDYLLIPFVLFYFYVIVASLFAMPTIGTLFFSNTILSILGALLCLIGLIIFLLGLLAFGKSFRIGIDQEHPDKLITTGIFSFTRNPLYIAFLIIFTGIFLLIPNWVLLIYPVVSSVIIHRQIIREEKALLKIYGEQYVSYCREVPRYLLN